MADNNQYRAQKMWSVARVVGRPETQRADDSLVQAVGRVQRENPGQPVEFSDVVAKSLEEAQNKQPLTPNWTPCNVYGQ